MSNKAGEQPTITPEDRKAYAALYLKDQGGPHSVHDLSVAAEIEMGIHDDWDGVQAFAAHRNLHESTPENNLAGGLWYRRWFALANTRTTSLAAQDGRCRHCDGTGDVHRADGEWLGKCDCMAAQDGLVDEILAHVERICGPISTEVCEVAGDDDRSVLRHNIGAVLWVSAIKGDKS